MRGQGGAPRHPRPADPGHRPRGASTVGRWVTAGPSGAQTCPVRRPGVPLATASDTESASGVEFDAHSTGPIPVRHALERRTQGPKQSGRVCASRPSPSTSATGPHHAATYRPGGGGRRNPMHRRARTVRTRATVLRDPNPHYYVPGGRRDWRSRRP